jgi:ABC-type nitrate/sulfonate/bicarbonate transport system permease component
MRSIYKILISFFIFLFLWQLVSLFTNNTFLPGPIKVLQVFFNLIVIGEIFLHIGLSLKRVILGFLIGIVLGFILAILFGFGKIGDYFLPIIELLRPIPPIAWIPLAILWLGIGDSSAVFIVFIAAFFPTFTNTFFGVRSIPKIYTRLSHNYNLSKYQYFKHIILPYVLPYFITGTKISLGLSWMVVIAAEMISANFGLGYLIELNRSMLNTEVVIAVMLFIGLIGFGLNKLLILIEKRLTNWRDVQNV